MQQEKRQSSSTQTNNQENLRLFPRSEDAECAIILLIISYRNFFDITCELSVIPEMFYSEPNKIIFETCSELYREKDNIDILIVKDKLIKTNKLNEIGGVSYLSGLAVKYNACVDIISYCQILKDKYLHRKLIEASLKAGNMAFNEFEDAEEILSELKGNIENITETTVKEDNTVSISEAVKASIDNMHDGIADFFNGVPPGIPTGFTDLNNIINGWKNSQLIILAARPGVGKTSLALKFAKKAAESKFNVLFYTFEMGMTEITDKLILSKSQVNAKSYNSRNMTLQEMERSENAGKYIAQLPITISDTPRMTVNDIIVKSKVLRKEGKCDIIFIDYLQLITTISKKDRTRENEVSEITRNLKIMAKELKVPVIALCQMNRNIESYNREPMLSDLRESGAIEQDADMVIFINRPGMKKEEEVTDKNGNVLENYMELLIKKNRSGKTGKIKLIHNDSFTDFYDWDATGQAKQIPVRNYYEPKKQEENDEMPF